MPLLLALGALVTALWDHRPDAARPQQAVALRTAVALVRRHPAGAAPLGSVRFGQADVLGHCLQVVAVTLLAGTEHQRNGAGLAVTGQVDFGGQPAPASVEGLALTEGGLRVASPLFRDLFSGLAGRLRASAACGCALMVVESTTTSHSASAAHIRSTGICLRGVSLESRQDARPGAIPLPAGESIEAGLAGAVMFRQIPPGGAGPQYQEDAVEDAPVFVVRVPMSAAALWRQLRFDGRELCV